MRKIIVVLCGVYLIAGGTLAAQEAADSAGSPAPAPDVHVATKSPEDNHLRDFKHKLIWKGPLAKTAVSALFNEVRNSPHEWGRGVDGFAKRAGNSFGQRAIKASVELGVSEWTHENLGYQRLGDGGVWRRLRHAAVGTFYVPRDNGDGGYTVAVGRITGAFTASQVARAWMPDRVATFSAGMQGFGGTLGLDVGLNIFREFWPRKR